MTANCSSSAPQRGALLGASATYADGSPHLACDQRVIAGATLDATTRDHLAHNTALLAATPEARTQLRHLLGANV